MSETPSDRMKYLMDHHIRIQFYSESTNGVLLGVTGTTLFGLFRVFDYGGDSIFCLPVFELIGLGSMLVAFLLVTLSFLPITKPNPEPDRKSVV